MADFVAAAAQMVFGAIVDEVVSRGVSVVVGKRKERASQGQYQERLRKAANEVELVLERTAKMPITELSLLRDRFELKRDFIQAISLLSVKHKKRQAQQEAVTSCSSSSPHGSLVTRPAMFSVSDFISMSKDELWLSCDNVEMFERFAESARNILTRVESGCSLRHRMYFSSPLVSHLFEWKTLRYRMVQADQVRDFVAWPARLEEERGVEVVVRYIYLDRKRPEKSFRLMLLLRLSESTDIVGDAINCLQSLTSQFNIVADTAIGELTLLASNLQDVSHSHGPPWVGIQEQHKEIIQKYRPDPLCCIDKKRHGSCGNNNVVSSELSHVFPEEVFFFSFECCISAPEYNLRCSSKRSVERNGRPPLKLSVSMMPHFVYDKPHQKSYAAEGIGDNDVQGIDVSMQQVGETVRSRALNCFLRQPKVTEYWIGWSTRHGAAFFTVKKLRASALKTSSRSKQS